jgi:transcriptional regulator with XRE-family HTH domain
MTNTKSSHKELVALGHKVRDLRRALSLSQEEFSVKAGLHRTYISDLESGLRNPTVTTLNKVAKALKVDLKDLWGK